MRIRIKMTVEYTVNSDGLTEEQELELQRNLFSDFDDVAIAFSTYHDDSVYKYVESVEAVK